MKVSLEWWEYTNIIVAEIRQEAVMTTSATPRKGKLLPNQKTKDKNRRLKDRRHDHSEGYMYISVVGWICRREKNRRNND